MGDQELDKLIERVLHEKPGTHVPIDGLPTDVQLFYLDDLRAVAREAQRGMAEDLLASLDWVSLRDGPEHGLQVVRRKIRERAGGDDV